MLVPIFIFLPLFLLITTAELLRSSFLPATRSSLPPIEVVLFIYPSLPNKSVSSTSPIPSTAFFSTVPSPSFLPSPSTSSLPSVVEPEIVLPLPSFSAPYLDEEYFSPEPSFEEEALSQNINYDHVAHAVPGRDYLFYDLDGDGGELIKLDGSRSHSHFYDPGPPPSLAFIVEWIWIFEGDVVGTSSIFWKWFDVGTTRISLRVRDSAGNEHEMVTEVTVLGSMRKGAFCYYYEGVGYVGGLSWNMAQGEKPIWGQEIEKQEFGKIPERFQHNAFRMRCAFSLNTGGEERNFIIKHSVPVQVVVDAGETHHVILENFDKGVQETSAFYNFEKGTHFIQILLWNDDGDDAMLQILDGCDDMWHDLSRQLPLIHDYSPKNSTLDGDGLLRLYGGGFWNQPYVYFGGIDGDIVEPDLDLSTKDMLVARIPPVEKEGVMSVSVGNRLGGSNDVNITFSTDAPQPVKFTEERLMGKNGEPYNVRLITNVEYGPDHRFYLAALDSFVYSLGVDEMLIVRDECQSESLGYLRTVIGLAFNWADPDLTLYVSSSIFYWEKSGLKDDRLWANGQISVMKPNYGEQCLGIVGDPIITGLPVSNHDHGVNNLLFDDEGLLHFQVGAATNAGVAAKSIGGIGESPLSAASLVADIFQPGFNGTVLYDSSIPAEARQVAGDVKVFSPGWRNSFDLTLHSNGNLYATDNGANSEFGNRSTGCDSEDLISPYHSDDRLGMIIEGKYAGHANRNRGRGDPSQCVWKNPFEPATDSFLPPLATFQSSTDGIVEYTADLFDGQLKGNLLTSKYSTNDESDNGRVYRIRLNEEGGILGDVETLWEGSGLSIETGPGGEILMPRLYESSIMVLRPVYTPRQDGRLVSVKPFRGGVKGGNKVIVTVDGGGLTSNALFAGRQCLSVTERSENRFTCTVPKGRAGSVKVSIRKEGGEVLESKPGWDYRYMRI